MNLGLETFEYSKIQDYIDDFTGEDGEEYSDYIRKYLDIYPEDVDNVKWYIGELGRFIKSKTNIVDIGQAWSTKDSFINKIRAEDL